MTEAEQRAFRKGTDAHDNGFPRESQYGYRSDSPEHIALHKAWLKGYDNAAAREDHSRDCPHFNM